MPKRIPEEVREEISRLYDDGIGLSPTEIARQTGISYASVYGMTRVKQMINPETGEEFESNTAYRKYLAKQIINPETGKEFESRTQYEEYLAKQRKERKENRELSDLVKTGLKELGKTQSWLSEQLGVSILMVNNYAQGKSVPKRERLEKLRSILNYNRNKGKSLDDSVED